MRVALVHGFTQVAASWNPIRSRLEAAGHTVVTPEVSGHGRHSSRRDDLPCDAERLAEEVGDAVWVGYSLGGRLVLHLAVQRPEVVRGLVLVSTTAGLDRAEERGDRRRADEDLARSLEAEGVDAFVERWLAGPLWSTLSPQAARADLRKTNTADGLAASLRLAGTGAHQPLWNCLENFRAPVLVVTGALDTKFGALGDRLVSSLSHAPVHRVELAGAGHAAPWEQPDAFVAAVDGWLRERLG